MLIKGQLNIPSGAANTHAAVFVNPNTSAGSTLRLYGLNLNSGTLSIPLIRNGSQVEEFLITSEDNVDLPIYFDIDKILFNMPANSDMQYVYINSEE